VFEYTQQEGLLVGFWCPSFVGSSLNVPGFHFHYLSADRQRGGHVLELQVQQGAKAYLQEVRFAGCRQHVILPRLRKHGVRFAADLPAARIGPGGVIFQGVFLWQV
jgi:acetolactate decarboxylase